MVGSRESSEKLSWEGLIVAVQPRIRLMRSFDERSHSYLGYVLRIDGICGGEAGEFLVAVGDAAQEKHRFQTGIELNGCSVTVDDPRKETAAFYKTSGIKVVKNAEDKPLAGPPFHGVPPDLETYRARGHRRLDTRTYYRRLFEPLVVPIEHSSYRDTGHEVFLGLRPAANGGA